MAPPQKYISAETIHRAHALKPITFGWNNPFTVFKRENGPTPVGDGGPNYFNETSEKADVVAGIDSNAY
jgi:hypothetical protein